MVIRVDDILAKQPAKPRFISKQERERRKSAQKTIGSVVTVADATPGSPGLAKQPVLKKREREVHPESDSDIDLPAWRRAKERKADDGVQVQELPAESWLTKPEAAMTARDWRIMYQELGITMSDKVRPLRQWSELDSKLLPVLRSLNYKEPTPIQRAAIPLALAGSDVIGLAETGSGKTASFVIPLVSSISAKDPQVRALVLAPTRELALQIESELGKFAAPFGLNGVALVGGRDLGSQAAEVAKGAQVLVATPGRLVDFLSQNLISLNECTYLVLDEADRMLDMGFEDQLKEIMAHLPQARRTMMYSATWPSSVQALAATYQSSPTKVTILKGKVNSRVEQSVELVEPSDLLSRLVAVLKRNKVPTIVFANSRATVDSLEAVLVDARLGAVSIHGQNSQEQREHSLSQFKAGKARVLLATDVVGRGIDIPDVSLVVNYNMPRTIDSYIHRIGRTGRAGRRGRAVTFVTEQDRPLFGSLKETLRGGGCPVPDFLKDTL